jgi:ABC-type sugar transport system ATPase subunit
LRIALERIEKSYGSRAVLRGIEAVIESGEFFCVLGPSGSGKTTLLRLIAGLERPDRGRIIFGDEDVTDLPARDRNVSMVFQNLALFPNMTAYENITFPLKVRRASEGEIRKRVKEMAELLRIEGILNRRVDTLSGGERQRVALARALIYEPRAFLLDEPLTALEPQLRRELREELKRIQRFTKITTIYVTHDQTEAFALADRIAVLGGGVFHDIGEPIRVYARPRTLWVAEFLSDSPLNVFTCNIEGDSILVNELGLRISAAMPMKSSERVKAVMRPEDIKLELENVGNDVFLGEIKRVEPVGDRVLYELEVISRGTRLIVKELGTERIWPLGMKVGIRIPLDRVLLFDNQGNPL